MLTVFIYVYLTTKLKPNNNKLLQNFDILSSYVQIISILFLLSTMELQNIGYVLFCLIVMIVISLYFIQ